MQTEGTDNIVTRSIGGCVSLAPAPGHGLFVKVNGYGVVNVSTLALRFEEGDAILVPLTGRALTVSLRRIGSVRHFPAQ